MIRLLTATDIAAALSTVDVNSLEKIEVIKGAASVLMAPELWAEW
jgi:outer membrane receptor protein involved in Fe transport